jgi:ribosomal protein L31E
MDIIIKSQRGDLYKVDCVLKHKTSIVIMPLGMGQEIGVYATEDRAKEVMAEIEEFIKRKYTQEQYNITYNSKISEVTKDFIIDDVKRHKELAIFKMPKE